ncbi:E3 ubiquitin-protein ligase ATL31-like [Cicer arietinum]|uniref:E3 ubiquitin-protein ligase ATL31-like n=1 Tax=Cicer arietinum TaxID=3827 RepID=UPI00032AAEDE
MVDSTPIIIIFLLHHHFTAEAQSPLQPETRIGSSTPNLWDVSSIGVIVGALIATLLLFFLLLMFLRRFTTSTSENNTLSESKCKPGTGITPQILKTFPILLYSFIFKNLKECPQQCSVCLGDFNNNDTLRVLPQCNHVFHPPCIDAWLSNHVTCPVCRTNLNKLHSLHFSISVDTQTVGGHGSEMV